MYPGYEMNSVSDPDGDGVNNLLEYAFGGDPILSDANMVAAYGEILTAEFVYVYNRRLDWEARGLSYAVQANTNLLADSWTTDGVSEVGIHMQHRNYDGTSAYLPYQFFEEIAADLTTGVTVDIPEPGTFSMLAGVLALGVASSRRRMR